MLDTWPEIARASVKISPDGGYAAFTIGNYPAKAKQTLMVRSCDNTWEKEFVNSEFCCFSNDDKHAVIKKADTLFFLELNTAKLSAVSGVLSYSQPANNTGRWFAWLSGKDQSTLTVKNLLTGTESIVPNVDTYLFNDQGTALVFKQRQTKERSFYFTLHWLNLISNEDKQIWSPNVGDQIPSLSVQSFSSNGDGFAFRVLSASNDYSVWCYRQEMQLAIERVDNQLLKLSGSDLVVSKYNFPFFAAHEDRLVFPVVKSPSLLAGLLPGKSKVTVWSYKDVDIQPLQNANISDAKLSPLFASISTESKALPVIIVKTNEIIAYESRPNAYVVVVNNFPNGRSVAHWQQPKLHPSFYCVSVKDGQRTLLNPKHTYLTDFSFSPDGRFLVYFDTGKGSYFSLDVLQKKTTDLTGRLSSVFENKYHYAALAPVMAWNTQNECLLYDDFDIWKIDAAGRESAVNVTHGFGRRNQIKLRLAEGPSDDGSTSVKDPLIFHAGQQLLLTGFDVRHKENGFFTVTVGTGQLKKLVFGPYVFYTTHSQKTAQADFISGMMPVKSQNGSSWIISRQSATEAPNFFATRDFKTFKPLTHIEPEKKVNWLTAELLSWKAFDGSVNQGILYKPQNFNPSKRYPVIINYYEELSQRLHQFPYPEWTTANINIPWFVSRGYLVFMPDIHYMGKGKRTKGAGTGVYNSVISGVKYLSKLSFVDAKHIGIQGHSFGGFETNYLITHSNLFAAAAEAAGNSDPISAYLTLLPFYNSVESYSKQDQMENDHENYHATPWEAPGVYRSDSPVMNADKVSAPLLIMHNPKDNQVQWRQGIEMYMALRRLGKRVWMLEYDNSGHTLNRNDAQDYSLRLTQFFDHYLKNEPQPVWMSRGIPPELKDSKTGLELDTSANENQDLPVWWHGKYQLSHKRL